MRSAHWASPNRYGSYFQGLKIRGAADSEPPLITGGQSVTKKSSSSLSSINVVNELWNLVMDKVTAVMDRVMSQTVDSDGNNGCDTISENFEQLDNDEVKSPECNTQNELSFEPIEDLWSEDNKPSSLVEENSTEEISVGDRVVIENCLGHWAWASPFEVLAIEGEMVRLDMVNELVEINRLKRIKAQNQSRGTLGEQVKGDKG